MALMSTAAAKRLMAAGQIGVRRLRHVLEGVDRDAAAFAIRQPIARDVRSEGVLALGLFVAQAMRRHTRTALAEERTAHVVDRRQLVGHRRRHENAPIPVVAIGVLDEGVRHEHVPKPLTYARHPAQ